MPSPIEQRAEAITMVDQKAIDAVLRTLADLNARHDLTILALSEPITNALPKDGIAPTRTSDASTTSTGDTATPASLAADLTHYKELFSKLRFSYVEQVTKEKFIKAIVGDPPLIVSPQENLELEKQNVAAKAELKALKTEVADMLADLERQGRDLARRYETIKSQTAAVRELPAKIAASEARIAELKAAQEPGDRPELSLPLGKTLDLVGEKKARKAELARQLEQLRAQVPRKRKELERSQAEMPALEAKRTSSMTAAKEAQRRREQALGGVEDDLEAQGRWCRASEVVLQNLLSLET